MRVLGIDHGEVRIGLALSDETGRLARPWQIVRHVARETDAEVIARLAAENEVKLIVVGLPTDSEGEIGYQARKVKRWAEALSQATSIPIEFWDESFSSVEAENAPRRRGEALDARAAAVMLQSYLDECKRSDSHPPRPAGD